MLIVGKKVGYAVLTRDGSKPSDIPWAEIATHLIDALPSSIQDQINSNHQALLKKIRDKGIQREHTVALFKNLEALRAQFNMEVINSKLPGGNIKQQINEVYATLDNAIDKVLTPNVSLVEVGEYINDFHNEFYRNKFSPNTKMAIFMTVMSVALLATIAGFTMGMITLNPIVAGIALLMVITGLCALYFGIPVAEKCGLHSSGNGKTFFTPLDTSAQLIKTTLMGLAEIIRNPMPFIDVDNTQESDLEANSAKMN